MRNQLSGKEYVEKFRSALAVVPSPRPVSRDESLRSETWKLSGTQGNVFWSSTSHARFNQGILHSTNQLATGVNPVQKSTGRLVARREEQNRRTVPMPSFSRIPSTMNSFFPAEVPQNSMDDQQRLQISELHFDKFPTHSTLSCWKMRFKTQVSACSSSPSEAMLWINDVEMVDSVDDMNHHAKFRVKLSSRILRCWMRGLRLL